MNRKRKKGRKGTPQYIFAVLSISTVTFASTYPDLEVTGPVPAPQFPAQFQTFEPPVNNEAPSSGAPEIAEWLRQNQPGDTMPLTGIRFSADSGSAEGRDTCFKVFGSSTLDCFIQRQAGMEMAITLPSALPADSVYMLWAGNKNGFGKPVLINATEAWWAGPDRIVPDKPFSVFGRNLTAGKSSAVSYAYLQSSDGSGEWLTSTSANPYRVEFRMPSGKAHGAYTLWMHNGLGGKYGWAEPLNVEIVPDFTWDGPVVNVKDYGAKGDGVSDDFSAINSAMNAARGMDAPTVYFPEGTYLISASLHNGKYGMRFLGDGPDKTVISTHSSYGRDINLLYAMFYVRRQEKPVAFKDLTVSSGEFLGASNLGNTLIYARNNHEGFTFDNVKFTQLDHPDHGKRSPIVDLGGSSYLTFQNCEFVLSGSLNLNAGARQSVVDQCTFRGINDNEFMINTGDSKECRVTRSTGMNYDASNPDNGHGWAQGRFFYASGSYGRVGDVYYSENSTVDLTVREKFTENQNTGEQYMTEFGRTKFRGVPTSATEGSVTFASLPEDFTDMVVVIVGGPGIGQNRLISSVSGNTINLASPWRVVPDSSSVLMIGNFARRHVVYNNSFDGVERAATTDIPSTAGVMPYGSQLEMVVDSNHFHQLKHGISNWGIQNEVNGELLCRPLYFNLFVDNELVRCRRAIDNSIATYSGEPTYWDVNLLGNVFRRNRISGSTQYAFRTRTWMDDHSISLCVYDQNITEDYAGTHIGDDLGQRHQVWVGNVFNSSRGGTGIEFSADHTPSLAGNAWSGFSKRYGGSLPGGILELPLRVKKFSSADSNGTLPVANRGTQSLNWSAASNKSWLELTKSSGSVGDEQTQDAVEYRVRSGASPAEGEEAVITVTSSDQTMQATVVYSQSGPTPPDEGPTPLLSHIEITGPVFVDEQTSATFYCDAHYVDASQNRVDPEWSVSGGSDVVIDENGILQAGDVAADETVQVLAEFEGKTNMLEVVIRYVPPTVERIEISGPASVNEGASAPYTCRAYYSDGSSVVVVPEWLEDSSYTTIDSSGTLSTGDVTADESVTVTAQFSGKSDSYVVSVLYVPPVLTGLSIVGPELVNELEQAQYSCVGQFSDGTSAVLSPVWSEGSAYASISAEGLLTAGDVAADQTVVVSATYEEISANQSVQILYVAPTLSYIEVSGPASVQEETSAQYSCEAVYSDGTRFAVTPTWSASGSASISSSGLLSANDVTSDSSATVTASYNGKSDSFSVSVAYVAPLLTGLAIEGPSYMDEQTSRDFTCVASYSDGTTAEVDPQWALDSAYAAVSGNGLVMAYDITTDRSVVLYASLEGITASHALDILFVPPPIVMTELHISGPEFMDENSETTLTCTATFSDGSQEAVQPGWSVDGAAIISADGVLMSGNIDVDGELTVTATHAGFVESITISLNVIGTQVVYPLEGYAGKTVQADLWDETAKTWHNLGEMDSPQELVIENVNADQWYWISISEFDESLGEWKITHGNWLSM